MCERSCKFPHHRKSSNQSLNHEVQIHRKPSCIYFRLQCFTFVSKNILQDLEEKKNNLVYLSFLYCLVSLSRLLDERLFSLHFLSASDQAAVYGTRKLLCLIFNYFSTLTVCSRNFPPLFSTNSVSSSFFENWCEQSALSKLWKSLPSPTLGLSITGGEIIVTIVCPWPASCLL